MWENEFDNIVFKKEKVQDMNFNQKIEVHDTYIKDDKTTIFKTVNDSEVINKAHLDKMI